MPDGGEDVDMETLRDLVRDTAGHEGVAIDPPRRSMPYRYGDLATTVWTAGNLLHHYGAGPERPVAVALSRTPEANDRGPGTLLETGEGLFAILGALAVGAPVDPDPGGEVDAPVLVAPQTYTTEAAAAPGTSLLIYGGVPSDASASHFEGERWSENPVEPPEPLAPHAPALQRVGGSDSLTHAQLLDALGDTTRTLDTEGVEAVRVSGSLSDPGTFVAGVLVPLADGLPIRPAESSVESTAQPDRDRAVVELLDGSNEAVARVDPPTFD